MKILFIIPARKGSKRLVGKNKKHFDGKPLICHSIDFAIKIALKDDSICVTSDDDEILDIAKSKSVNLVVKRPVLLAGDSASTFDVVIHACSYALERNIEFDTVVLLQPTTPFRSINDFRNMKNQFIDENISVLASIAVKGDIKNRVFYDPQTMERKIDDLGKKGYLNGSLYFYNYNCLKKQNSTLNIDDTNYYEMSPKNSIDIDTIDDWNLALKYL